MRVIRERRHEKRNAAKQIPHKSEAAHRTASEMHDLVHEQHSKRNKCTRRQTAPPATATSSAPAAPGRSKCRRPRTTPKNRSNKSTDSARTGRGQCAGLQPSRTTHSRLPRARHANDPRRRDASGNTKLDAVLRSRRSLSRAYLSRLSIELRVQAGSVIQPTILAGRHVRATSLAAVFAARRRRVACSLSPVTTTHRARPRPR